MADLSSLGALSPIDPIDMNGYVGSKDFAPMAKKGRYHVQAPPSFPSTSFGRTAAGALSIQVDPTIVGPTNDGTKLRFIKVSAKPFKRSGVTVSQAGDYLQANGFQGKISSEQELADAVESTANNIYEVDIDWRVYSKESGFSLEGMEKFPKLASGDYQPWIEDPSAKDAEGNPVRLRANLVVTRYVPRS